MDKINQDAITQLKKFKEEGCHMLVPCMDQIADVSAGFRLIVTPILLRSHPKEKDVYPHESAHYDQFKNEWRKESGEGQWRKKVDPQQELVRISGQGLEKLAQHAAIVWDRPTVRIDKAAPGRQLCEIAGAIRMPDGFSFYRIPDLYGMDLDIVREQLEATYTNGKTGDDLKKGQYKVDRDLLQKKTNQTRLCISGARNRVIRKILGVDGTYTVESLEKPFIAIRVIPWLDMSDAYTRKLVTDMQVKQMAITSLFGGQIPDQAQIPHDDQPSITYDASIPADKCGGDIVDAEEATPYHLNSHDTQDSEVPFGLESQGPTPAESLRLDFTNSDATAQCGALTTLCVRKGKKEYFDKWLKDNYPAGHTMAKLSPEKRLEIYDVLVAIPDAEKGKVAA